MLCIRLCCTFRVKIYDIFGGRWLMVFHRFSLRIHSGLVFVVMYTPKYSNEQRVAIRWQCINIQNGTRLELLVQLHVTKH